MMRKLKTKIKTFSLPLEEEELNFVINNENNRIMEKQVRQDKSGCFVVYLEWEYCVEDHPAVLTRNTEGIDEI